MEVILKEDINKLGHRGDVVKVAEGYGRNYLIPHKLAIEATAGNKAVIEQMKASAVRKSAKEKGRPRTWASSSTACGLSSPASRASMTSCSARSLRPTSRTRWKPRASPSTAARSISTCR